MKLLPTDKHDRTLWATELPTPTPHDLPDLEITIGYTGDSSCEKAIPLDSFVIPQIKRAVNSFDELLAALRQTIDALYNETHGQPHSPWIESVMADAQNAIAKAVQP